MPSMPRPGQAGADFESVGNKICNDRAILNFRRVNHKKKNEQHLRDGYPKEKNNGSHMRFPRKEYLQNPPVQSGEK